MKLALILIALTSGFSLSAAVDEFPARQCETPPPDDMAIAQSAVVTAQKANFYHDGDSGAYKLCPENTSACVRKGYLVKNDKVLVYQAYKGFICVVYPTAKIERSGWMWRSDIKISSIDAKPSTQKWLGTWRSLRARIVISRDGDDQLQISGDGTGGPRGDNMADFDADALRKGDRIYFTAEQQAPSKFSGRLVGDFLIISQDETEIGGEGVMFGGRYVRSAK